MNRTVVMGAMALVLGSGLADLASGAANRSGASVANPTIFGSAGKSDGLPTQTR